jgi:membrane protease YdiL (CAAX protease family)
MHRSHAVPDDRPTDAHADTPTLGELARLAILWPAAATLPLAFGLPPAVAIACAAAVVAAYLRQAVYAPRAAVRVRRRAILRVRSLGRAWPLALLAVAAALAAALALHAVEAATGAAAGTEAVDLIGRYADRGPVHAAAVAFVGVGVMPLMEELAVRGALTTALESRVGSRLALPLASLVFAVGHLRPVQLPGLFVAGLLLGALAWGARSVWPAVLAHALWNALAFAARLHPAVVRAMEPAWPSWWLAVLLLAASAALVWLAGRLRRATATEHMRGDAPSPEATLR